MPRKRPELNNWKRYVANMPPYHRDAGRILFGKYDKLAPSDFGYLDAGEPVTDPCLVHWINALRAFDNREHHDKAPLIALLDSDIDLPQIVRGWLADLLTRYQLVKTVPRANDYERTILILLEMKGDPAARRELVDDVVAQRQRLARTIARYNFTKRSGGQPTPAYDLTDADAKLHGRFQVADADVRAYIAQGDGVENAVDKVAEEHFPPVDDEKSNHPKPDTERLMAERAEFADALEDYHRKYHASSRRMEKRRKY